ncbi:hypothetical protein ARGLB_054_00890 [Arthrobacter globiformis NBRC 12137]|uniref:SHOCT domain-containing protein n=1 Tax=Arthrobacter globiformis (strain ATCC 8010 / DSM 20124 / JCM 1332 / NBRC 12137 / NCIMB 8907 / NRRL B-2979 / 168) TaxID=1077972 RepID=H0QMN4_ARTG1|nr:hypothetical protein [Arthrobacter globiformis]GAB14085.1 hypothetical protein ARGLB_054_00890 [Arthrobacter globiformis NBRC 12137]
MDTHREGPTVFDLFFWIIILAVLVPMGMRMYRRSVQQRNQGPGLPGQYPGQFPNQIDDQFGNQPGSRFGGPFQGRPDNRPGDGYTQQDYFSGGLAFPQRGGREELPPLNQPYPGQPYPNQPGPGGTGAPSWRQGPVPYEDSPEYRANPPQPQQNPVTGPAPSAPPPPSAPQGFRARKLAELDQQYSDGQISMEEYMARRNDIMNG